MPQRNKKKIIAANWKMNPLSLQGAKNLTRGVLRSARVPQGTEVILCPPFPWLGDVKKILRGKKGYSLGAQDVFWENPDKGGAFTGEVSCQMLKDLGAEYVIVGHSERRRVMGESDEMVNKKLLTALNAGLKVILCVGEWVRDENYVSMVTQQLLASIENISVRDLSNIIIAYEPVWAIGTGEADTPDSALSAAILIRKIIMQKFQRKNMPRVKVLYGGSVNKNNAYSFISQNGIDGALVGGESLNAENFAQVIKV